MSPFVLFGLILFQFEFPPHPFLKLLLLVTVYVAEFSWPTFVTKITSLAGRSIRITMILYSVNSEFSYLDQSRSTRTNICICTLIVDKLRSIILLSGRSTPLSRFKPVIRFQRCLTFFLQTLIVISGDKSRISIHHLMLLPRGFTAALYSIHQRRFIIILGIHLKVEFPRFRGHPIMLSAGVLTPHILSV